MIHDEFERLADQAFEGRVGEPERGRLEALAAAHPELRERWEDLQAARTGLAGATLEPLPPGLHEALVGATRVQGARRHEPRGWLSHITAAIQVRPVFALGGAVAAGLAIGVVGFGLVMGGLGGGLGAGRDLAPATSASLPPAPVASGPTSSAIVERAGARVELSARREAADIIVRLEARDATPGTVTLAWDPAASRLVGLRWEGADAPSFAPTPGRVTLPIPAASGIELSFREIVNGGSSVRATLSAAGGDEEVTLRLPR
jgi:hypothetical protein